jgi:hypothetical protein
MPQGPTKTPRWTIYVLIAVGFAGLIGAHEVAGPGDNADTVPFVLASIGTLAFVVAGVMAYRMLRGR